MTAVEAGVAVVVAAAAFAACGRWWEDRDARLPARARLRQHTIRHANESNRFVARRFGGVM